MKMFLFLITTDLGRGLELCTIDLSPPPSPSQLFVTDRSNVFLLLFIFMLCVLSVCLPAVLVGVFLIYYGRVAAFLEGLFFSFVNGHLDEPVDFGLLPT